MKMGATIPSWHGYTPLDWQSNSKIAKGPNKIRYSIFNENDVIATILPALPCRPKPEHAQLLYRYASEGLWVQIQEDGQPGDMAQCGEFTQLHPSAWKKKNIKITHALTEDGQRVEIAIED
jgi:hypothetical protein